MTERAERLLTLLPAAQLDLLLISDLANVRYMTGYTGSNGLALVGPQTRTFVTDPRYVEQAASEVEADYDRRQEAVDLFEGIPGVLPAGAARLGFDDRALSVRQHARLRELLPERVELVAAGGLIERLRAVKDAREVGRIRAAAELADDALAEVLDSGLRGRTERELARSLTGAMETRGGQEPSFAPIVAAGAHAALPHAQPREVAVQPGHLVVIDWGVRLDGYCSDCTRTVAVGEPGDRAREIHGLVLAAQRAALAAVQAGAEAGAVDGIARELITAGGHGEHFGHSLGHGVGLEVHEAPRLSQHSDAKLESGNVVTIEPGVYMPGELGVRIEDLVLVTTGGSEILTGLDKRLISVG